MHAARAAPLGSLTATLHSTTTASRQQVSTAVHRAAGIPRVPPVGAAANNARHRPHQLL
jgi:hypothetical protein